MILSVNFDEETILNFCINCMYFCVIYVVFIFDTNTIPIINFIVLNNTILSRDVFIIGSLHTVLPHFDKISPIRFNLSL